MQAPAAPSGFLPPSPRSAWPSWGLSVLVHSLLVLALTWGLQWNRHQVTPSFSAEIWSAVPTPAAPPPPLAPTPKSEPEIKPEPKPEPPPAPPKIAVAPGADLAIAAQRKKEHQKALQAQQQAAKLKKQEDERQRQTAEQQKNELKKRKEKEAQAKREAEETRRIEEQRKANLNRLNAMAATANPSASNSTQIKASGPSDSWAGRIQGAVLPRITFTDENPGHIVASIKVQLAPDGTIVNQELIKSSGNKTWDDAVMRALEKTGKLPRDTDGRIHSPVVIDFNPRSLQR